MPLHVSKFERFPSADRNDLALAALEWCRAARDSDGVNDSRFYWIVNGGLNSFGSDLVDTPYSGPGADYPFSVPLFYTAPDLIVQFTGFGFFHRAIGNPPTDPGEGNNPTTPDPVERPSAAATGSEWTSSRRSSTSTSRPNSSSRSTMR